MAAVRMGKAMRIRMAVTSMFQVKMGQPEHGHARGPQVEVVVTRLTPVKMAEKPVRAMPEDPQVGRRARGELHRRQRGVAHPPVGGGPAGHQEAEQHRDRPAQVQPVRQGVQPGERHVGRADLQGHDVVGQTAEGEGAGEQVQHQAAVHGEQLVVLLEAQRSELSGLVSWVRSNRAMIPARKNMMSDVHHVVHADQLVIGARHPLEQPGGPSWCSCSCSWTTGRSARTVMRPPSWSSVDVTRRRCDGRRRPGCCCGAQPRPELGRAAAPPRGRT